MPRLSIVVPVYNTESYLKRCLDSIVGQSFTDFELILVDDGSKDNSSVICDRYGKSDDRIKVIHKENEGVSIARNTGMTVAKGEYLTVVDSDDWLETEMYQSMFKYIDEYELDVVMCDCIKEYSNKSEVYTHEIRPGFYSLEQIKNEYYPHLLMMENVEYPATISNYLIVWRRSITSDNNLQYLGGVRNSEDLLFGAQIMSLARSFYYMKGQALYHYCIRDNSASNSFLCNGWNDFKQVYTESIRFFSNIDEYDFGGQTDILLLFFLFNYFEEVRHSDICQIEKRNIINKLLVDETIQRMFMNVRIDRLPISWKQKIKTYMIKSGIGINYLLRKR
ncbi:MAG: glycosyltransferase [Erysipelotrichaceae bacterium]|nr:glycosyltransferase [Clostridia bacterium]MBQ6217757.1 glycosyltransferase [Erysipelotrichaceae bacterium]